MEKVDLPKIQSDWGYPQLNCQHSRTNSCEAKIPEVIDVKNLSDASGCPFVSMPLRLDFLEIFITALPNRRRYLTITSKRKI